MIITQENSQEYGVLETARSMCVAARTAPKTKGKDYIVTLILTGEDKDRLAAKTEEVGWRDYGEDAVYWFVPDADAIRRGDAVVLIGAKRSFRGVPSCGFCGFADCKACAAAGGKCAYSFVDLGVAVSAAALAASDARVDNRILWSAGKAATEMGYLEGEIDWLAIPLSVSGKNVFFDRRRSKRSPQAK